MLTKHNICRMRIAAVVLIALMVACKHVSPDTATGPVIDASRNIGVARYRVDSPAGPVFRWIIVRHTYYFSQPAPWTILSSGDSSPRSHFEETGIYVLSLVGEPPKPEVTRIAQVPRFGTDGVTPPRVHVAVNALFRHIVPGGTFIYNPTGASIVYVQDGPVYGILDINEIVDPSMKENTMLSLLVDAHVSVAALARDGVTLAYVDNQGRLFIRRIGEAEEPLLTGEPFLFDLRTILGPVTITAMQWTDRGSKLLVRLDRNPVSEPEVWGVDISFVTPSFVRESVDPETVREPGSDQLPFIDEVTRSFGPDEWGIPEPSQFSLVE